MNKLFIPVKSFEFHTSAGIEETVSCTIDPTFVTAESSEWDI